MKMEHKNIIFKCVFYCCVVLTFLSGCANNKYACKGQPDGVTCADPVTVYRLTEDADQVVSSEGKSRGKSGEPMADNNKKRKEVVEGVLRPPVDMARPVLEPAQVLRIWIAPWVDESQDLHGASYVFTEITPRRWSFGINGAAVPHATYPFQVAPAAQKQENGIPSVKSVPEEAVKAASNPPLPQKGGGTGASTMDQGIER